MDIKERIQNLLAYKKKQEEAEIGIEHSKYLEGYIRALEDILELLD